ncbi:hypothetical protein K2P97_12075 [bacterium]|nr:hypothetical protein [bacterium]
MATTQSLATEAWLTAITNPVASFEIAGAVVPGVATLVTQDNGGPGEPVSTLPGAVASTVTNIITTVASYF